MMDDDDDDDDELTMPTKFIVSSPDVYNNIMVQSIENMFTIFNILFLSTYEDTTQKLSKSTSFDFSAASSHPKWTKYESSIISFFKSLQTTLLGLEHNGFANNDIGVYTLTNLKEYIPLISCIPKVSRTLLKLLIKIWAEGPSVTEGTTNIQGFALLRIRQMSTTLPGTFTEDCFRSMYLIFARVSKSYNEYVSPSIMFMIESIAQLYLTDVAQAYQQAFLYIRQLALHLRSVILKKTTETSKLIDSWQYLNCVRLWTKVLSMMPKTSELGNLIFPLSQIISGCYLLYSLIIIYQ